jgi:hypothetical protein
MRIFANMIGVFPVGTAVRLKSGRLAVVLAVSDDPHLCHRPRVRPVTDATGIQRELPEMDLALRGPDGDYPDEIVAAVDADSLGLDIARYFI